MNNEYEKPLMEVVLFNAKDIACNLSTSNTGKDEIPLPFSF